MIRAVALILALCLSTAAQAQDRTVALNVRGGLDPRNVAPKPCSFLERNVLSVPDNICEARAVAAQHKAVGDLIAAGNCDAAVKASLSTGDLAYVRQVRDYCAPAPKP